MIEEDEPLPAFQKNKDSFPNKDNKIKTNFTFSKNNELLCQENIGSLKTIATEFPYFKKQVPDLILKPSPLCIKNDIFKTLEPGSPAHTEYMSLENGKFLIIYWKKTFFLYSSYPKRNKIFRKCPRKKQSVIWTRPHSGRNVGKAKFLSIHYYMW